MSSEGVDTFISTIHGNSDKFRNSKRERSAVLSSINIIKNTTTNPDDSAKLDGLISSIQSGGKRSVTVIGVRSSKRQKQTPVKILKGGAIAPPEGSIVLGNGSVINPNNGAIIKNAGYVTPPQAGGIYSSSGTIIPSVITIDKDAPTADVEPYTTAPIGSIILGNGSIIDRVSGQELAPPGTIKSKTETPLKGGITVAPAFKVLLPNPPGNYPVVVPPNIPVNTIVLVDGSGDVEEWYSYNVNFSIKNDSPVFNNEYHGSVDLNDYEDLETLYGQIEGCVENMLNNTIYFNYGITAYHCLFVGIYE